MASGSMPAVARPAANHAFATAISRYRMREDHFCAPAACPLAYIVVRAGLVCWKGADCSLTREGGMGTLIGTSLLLDIISERWVGAKCAYLGFAFVEMMPCRLTARGPSLPEAAQEAHQVIAQRDAC